MNLEDFEAIFRGEAGHSGPYTLDSPIRYDVWRSYALNTNKPVDLLLELEHPESTKALRSAIREDLGEPDDATRDESLLHWQVAGWGDVLAVKVPFQTFLRVIVSQSSWSHLIALGRSMSRGDISQELDAALHEVRESRANYDQRVVDRMEPFQRPDLMPRFRWFSLLAVRIGHIATRPQPNYNEFATSVNSGAVRWLFSLFENAMQNQPGLPQAESISINREVRIAVRVSRQTVKADAAARVFDIDASGIGWAVLDSGIDARHLAFRRLDADGRPIEPPFDFRSRRGRVKWLNQTRVVRTYDFRRARFWSASGMDDPAKLVLSARVEMDGSYPFPIHDHGTHVAGIIAADWRPGNGQAPMQGVCPDLELWDFRVLDDRGFGAEYDIIAALRAVKYINDTEGRIIIHGVNLSLSMTHEVENFACGWTPVCRAAETLVDSGVVVVVAAGNAGFTDPSGQRTSVGTGYNPISITDPGNAENVITVGSTGRNMPYRFGTSYFSSRGPTADGRAKPDLLAPGEGIYSTVPGDDEKSYDGTSQASPHVSGVTALLLGRYPELRGDPLRIKQILCDSANDLNRDRYFQGHGMVDALRALQSI